MSLLTVLGLACFAAAIALAFAVPLEWTTAVCLPCVGLGVFFLVWAEVRRNRPHRPGRDGKHD
ncbi:MAG TPA: hypothetical protein VGV38_09440 [Pyrinomonadaceae bacterium]|nr:hypothetical protein [Pyrinomonadaceae bacterium]